MAYITFHLLEHRRHYIKKENNWNLLVLPRSTARSLCIKFEGVSGLEPFVSYFRQEDALCMVERAYKEMDAEARTGRHDEEHIERFVYDSLKHANAFLRASRRERLDDMNTIKTPPVLAKLEAKARQFVHEREVNANLSLVQMVDRVDIAFHYWYGILIGRGHA